MVKIISALLIVCGVIGFIIASVKRRRMLGESRSWHTVRGKIVKSEVINFDFEDGEKFAPNIEYKYTVGSGDYKSSNIFIEDRFYYSSEEIANQRTELYHLGADVIVYYDLHDPSRSCLIRKVGETSRFEFIMSGFLVGTGIIFLLCELL